MAALEGPDLRRERDFDRTLLVETAGGLGKWEEDGSGRQKYVKSEDCTGEGRALAPRGAKRGPAEPRPAPARAPRRPPRPAGGCECNVRSRGRSATSTRTPARSFQTHFDHAALPPLRRCA